MSLIHSPAVVTDGLQFYYDAANNKNVNTGSNFIVSPTNMTNPAYWGSSAGMTVTANAAVAPDGTMTACSFALTGVASVWSTTTLTTATIGTGQQFSSIYAKANTSSIFTFNSYYVGDTEVNITFTLTGNGATDTPTQSIIKYVGNGWYLCTIFTPARVNAGSAFGFRFWPAGRGSTTGGNYFWGPTLKNSFTDLVGNNTLTPNVLAYDSANNGAMSFNGSSSYLIATENSALNTQTPSVEVWIKTNSLTQNAFFFEKGLVNTQYSLFQASGTLYWRNHNGSTITDLTATVATYINTSQYVQIVATYTSGSRKIYINGVQVASDTATFTIPTNANGCSIGVYGGYNGARSYWYNGNIAIVKVYNKALSASEVSQNFNAIRGRFGI